MIEGNAALKNVTALTKGQTVYAPNDTYTNESIITYTEILNSIADSFEKAVSYTHLVSLKHRRSNSSRPFFWSRESFPHRSVAVPSCFSSP